MEFIRGGPAIPPAFQTEKLVSWTESSESAAAFAGTARYSLFFDAPTPSAGGWMLDLGRVCDSARVKLNGTSLGTVILSPFQFRVDRLKPGRNVLKVEVTNVSANRVRDLDRRHIPWKVMCDINLVDIRYKPFDAANWPVRDAGLMGPVTLVPVRKGSLGE